MKQQSTKFSTRDFVKIVHDRNHLARNVNDAWRSYIIIKCRSDVKIQELLQREEFLGSKLQDQQKEFAELGECTEQLIEEITQLQGFVNQQRRQNASITSQLRDKTTDAKQLSNHVSELQIELYDANKTLNIQQDLLEEIEHSRDNVQLSTFELESRCQSLYRDGMKHTVLSYT